MEYLPDLTEEELKVNLKGSTELCQVLLQIFLVYSDERRTRGFFKSVAPLSSDSARPRRRRFLLEPGLSVAGIAVRQFQVPGGLQSAGQDLLQTGGGC